MMTKIQGEYLLHKLDTKQINRTFAVCTYIVVVLNVNPVIQVITSVLNERIYKQYLYKTAVSQVIKINAKHT